MKTLNVVNPLYDAAYPAQKVAYTGTAGNSSAYPPGPQAVYVSCSTAAYVAVGEGVTATTSNGLPVAANVPVVIAVPFGTGAAWRVSAIQDSSGGNLFVKPINIE